LSSAAQVTTPAVPPTEKPDASAAGRPSVTAAQPAAGDGPADAAAKKAEAEVAALIRQLNDPSITVRDEAERRLSAVGLSQAQLERSIQDPASTPEQRTRLERLGARTLYQTPRGALGVSFKNDELVVGQCHEGFDSQRVLKPGDQLVAVDRHLVVTIDDLRPAVIMHPPGTKVPLKVVRDGRVMTVTIELGDFGALPRSPLRDSVTYRQCDRAWALRLGDLLEDRRKGRALDTGLSADAWAKATKGDGGDKKSALPFGDSTLVAAGSPRANGDDGRARPRLTGIGGEGRDQRMLRQMEDLRRFAELRRKIEVQGLDPATREKLQAELDEVMARVFDDLDMVPGQQRIP
jgi:hypothetical protein